MREQIAVIGLGYVGLPLAVALAEQAPVTAFDIDSRRVRQLARGRDTTGQIADSAIAAVQSNLSFTREAADLAEASFYILTVPTPLDASQRPDLSAIKAACATVGRTLDRGDVVVLESTVYPGATEEFLGPCLAEASGLSAGTDFALGYSPERINPGDSQHSLKAITKIIAAQDAQSLARLRRVYAPVITAGLYEAPDIPTAEAAKVIENTQRDLNIALMNELALIFDRLGLRTADVLAAAGTKWNFLAFQPGLVGGHCIGVDPYYLTAKAEAVGYDPQVILAGRRINDGMGQYIGRHVARHVARSGARPVDARVGILGLSFKENVPDIRNSRVPDIAAELAAFGVRALVHDPYADPDEAQADYGLALQPWSAMTDLDALILAVPHSAFSRDGAELGALIRPGGLLCDIKSVVAPASVPEHCHYWSL